MTPRRSRSADRSWADARAIVERARPERAEVCALFGGEQAPPASPPALKAVLLCLHSFAGASETCWPSVATISQRTALTRRTVQRTLRSLELRGLISSTPVYDDRGGRRASTWTIEYDALERTDPMHTRPYDPAADAARGPDDASVDGGGGRHDDAGGGVMVSRGGRHGDAP